MRAAKLELPPAVQQLVEASAEQTSWRRRLALVHELLLSAATTGSAEQHEQALAYAAIYLRLIGTGALVCAEDGGHYRPSHHARLSAQINALLASRASETDAPLRRRIWPWLPSYGSAYTRAEPLTRIRDIAHRNDIPSELKREIKTTLQNKLHRSAGPEDLVTARALLARFHAAPEAYPPAFVEQFEIFVDELSEFFGAGDLISMFALARADDPALVDAVTAVDLEAEASVELLAAINRLRTRLAVEEHDASERARRRRVLDLRLEALSFSRASELLNALEQARPRPAPWGEALALCEQLLAGLALGELPQAEPLRRELAGLLKQFEGSPGRDALLRLKALLDRCQRELADYVESTQTLFAARVERLGEALGVSRQTVMTFVEGDLRGGLAFSLSRLTRLLGRRVRQQAGLSPWVPLVTGEASGRLLRLPTLDALPSGDGGREPLLLLLDAANGEETIPPRVRGILLAHDLPQLSHLGVRARQAGVPFACCDAVEELELLAAHEGRGLRVEVSISGLRIVPVDDAELKTSCPSDSAPAARTAPRASERASRLPSAEQTILQLSAASLADAGAKSVGARRLHELAGGRGSAFRAPVALIVAADALAIALADDPTHRRRYHRLLAMVSDCAEDVLAEPLAELRRLIGALRPPALGVLHAQACELFGAQARLMVRSSSNVEDNADDAGAGLYDSLSNVPIDDHGAALGAAVAEVWASLWSERAVLARRRSGLAVEAKMAVLLQPLVTPELSFILHTVDPFGQDPGWAYAELAVGHGEILASGRVRGTPFRLRCEKAEGAAGQVETLAFASFDQALWPAERGGLVARAVDYDASPLVSDAHARLGLGRRLGQVAAQLERQLGGPQDVEGVVVGDTIWVVQSRPQQGVVASGRLETSTQEGPPRDREETMKTTNEPSPGRPRPPLHGLLDLQVRGDDALLALAQRRFASFGLGAELYAANVEQLQQRLRYAPSEPSMVHLPRDLDLLEQRNRRFVLDMARQGAGRVRGMVLHDQRAMRDRADDYRRAVEALSKGLEGIGDAPTVHIEYAVCIEPERFCAFFEQVAGLTAIGACIDIGHVGMHAARERFAARQSGRDACALAPYHPELPGLVDQLQQSLTVGLPAVLQTIERLGGLDLPLHFHLHDGHPLWVHNPYGVSDHMSFLDTIPVPFEHRGARCLTPLFGPDGLGAILGVIHRSVDLQRCTLTLEIHPQPGREALDERSRQELFGHWEDLTNAERMNYWVSILRANAVLLDSRWPSSQLT
jgi:phosphoglucan,water dikinase